MNRNKEVVTYVKRFGLKQLASIVFSSFFRTGRWTDYHG